MTSHVPALIVGGGISGLVCAHALRKARVDAQLLEASPRPGGVIRSERRDGYLLELGPQSFSGTAPLRTLCADLHIETEIVEAPPSAPRYVLVDGALRPVPLNPPALLLSPLLSAATKGSFARDLFGNSQPPEQDESVADFVRRKFTAELLDKLAGPFISGIYAGDPERLSVRSAFPQIYEAEKSAGSVIRGMKRAAKAHKGDQERPALLSFRAGNEALIRALSAKLGTALRSGAEVVRIERSDEASQKAYQVTIQANGREERLWADRLILATPTDVAGRLLRGVNPAFDTALRSIEYAPIAVVSLGYLCSDVENSLNGFGFLVPRSSGLRVLGTIWNSSLFEGRGDKEHALLTSFVGGATDPQAVALSSEELTSLVHTEIAPLLALSRPPTFSSVTIYPRALPQYNLGHAERLAAIERLRREAPNLWLAGNYLRGPSIGACVEHSLAVARDVLSQLRR